MHAPIKLQPPTRAPGYLPRDTGRNLRGVSASRERYGVAASRCRQRARRPGTIRRQPVGRYRQGGSGREGSGPGRCGHDGRDRKGSRPSPAASAPLDRRKGQRGIDLGHGSPAGRRSLVASLTEQLGCLCGCFLGLAEVLFYVHWPSSCLVACYWSDTAHRRSANWSRARNAEARQGCLFLVRATATPPTVCACGIAGRLCRGASDGR